MNKVKRIVQRPWGRKYKGAWVIQPKELLTALRQGDTAQLGVITVGTKNLIEIIRNMDFPNQELLIKSNGKLEFENIGRHFAETPSGRKCVFRLPRLRQYFSVCNKAWLPKETKRLVILKPRKF